MLKHELKKSVVDRIEEDIKLKLFTAKINFGEKIDINRLNKEYGVSSTPIRDALNRLEQSGLVVVSPRKGYFLKEYNSKDVEDIFQLRKILEIGALEIGINKIEDEVIKRSIKTTKELIKEFSKKNLKLLKIEDVHLLIINSCENERLKRAYFRISDEIEVLISKHSQGRESFNLHLKIKEAILERNFNKTKKFLEEHLDTVKEELIKLIK